MLPRRTPSPLPVLVALPILAVLQVAGLLDARSSEASPLAAPDRAAVVEVVEPEIVELGRSAADALPPPTTVTPPTSVPAPTSTTTAPPPPPAPPAPTTATSAPAPAPPPPAPPPVPAPASPPPRPAGMTVASSAEERRALELINQDRVAAGLGPLQVSGGAQAVARRWSTAMTSRGLEHNPNLRDDLAQEGITDWRRVGENVGYGSDVDEVHDLFMSSSTHRANILGAGFSSVGIGTVRHDGTLWITMVFVGY